MWDSGWDNIFKSSNWGQYPCEELVRFISRSFGNRDNHRNIAILEVGCGPGANLWFLAREGYSTFGIDGSRVAIKKAEEKLTRENLHANLYVGDILSLPYEDSQFDCVIDIECIYANSMKDSKKIIQEIKRVLKPQGLFFSKSFSVGTYGDNKGERLKGEKNTYTKLDEGALRSGYGIIRFMDREEIDELYAPFEIKNVDYLIRGIRNGEYEVKEWLITCEKS